MMSLTFGLFTKVSGSGPLGPLVSSIEMFFFNAETATKRKQNSSIFKSYDFN